MENESKNNNSKVVLAYILIAVGVFWTLRQLGIYYEFPHFILENIFYPLRRLFHHVSRFIFSWPMILIIIGGVLLVGKRSAGFVLIIVGGIFILPKIFFIPGITISLLLPVLLIGIGVAMIARRI